MKRYIRNIPAILFLITTTSKVCFSQDVSIQDLFMPKMPMKTDTLYYPFYDGVQMIEVDHIAYWDKKIFFLEQSEPRAMPHAMFQPQPLGNEYFFRDTLGVIVKAFNTSQALSVLTKHFENIPIDKKSNTILALFPYHSSKKITSQGAWAYSPQAMYLFDGYYKVCNTNVLVGSRSGFETHVNDGVLFGLIDTLGNIKVSLDYQEILPLNDRLIVKQEEKWGIIDKNKKVDVPIMYDRVDNYYSDPKNNKFLYLQNDKKYVSLYDVIKNKVIKIGSFDRIYDHYVPLGYFMVQENKLFGLLDMQGSIVLQPIYNRINNVNRPDCIYEKCVSVVKDRKIFDIDLGN